MYEQEGCSNEEARDEASKYLLLKYKEYVMKVYQNGLITAPNVQDPSLHRHIMNDDDYLKGDNL